MTQKRFKYNVNKNTIEQDGKFVAYMNNVDGIRITNKLNVFQKENDKLKSENEDMRRLIDNISLQRDEFLRGARENANRVGKLKKENEQLKKELKRCKDWINSDKNDYELTLAFIKNKGYSLKDILEYEKELKK